MIAQTPEPLVLTLADLLPDAQGEVVMFGDGVPITLMSAEPIAASGLAEPHVTAAGIDVTGLAYLSFPTGVTVYYPSDQPVTVGEF